MTDQAAFLALADRCEHEPPSRDLDAAIAKALGWRCVDLRNGPRYWLEPGVDLGEAMRTRLQPGVHLAYPPWFTDDLMAAMRLNTWVIVGISEIGGDGLPIVELGNPETTPAGKAVGLGAGPNTNLAITFCAATMRAKAKEKG